MALLAAVACALALAGHAAAAGGGGVGCTIVGTPGPDVLVGTAGDDVICGRGGNDRLRGGGGDDRLRGGRGDDRLRGGDGNDVLRGGRGDDRLLGGNGNDILFAGGGADVMDGGPGSDLADYGAYVRNLRLTPGDGANDGRRGERDTIRSDVENLRGGSGDDILRGTAGPNRLRGSGGADRLRGGAGNDLLFGGLGPDVLDGRDAAAFVDALLCGGGSDRALADTGDQVRSDCEDVTQNRAPSDISLSNASVAENEPPPATVGTFSATDPDAGDTHAYGLVGGAGDADNGSFTIAGTTLRTSAIFDYETKSSYSIRVRVTDGAGASYEEQLTISVTDVDENASPVAVDDQVATSEDTRLELPVSGAGSPAANDTDADSDPLTVTAVSNAAGGAASIVGGLVRFDPTANLCGPGAGGFDYTVSDGQGGSDVGRVTVDIGCVDDSPTAVNDAATVAEDAAATAIDVLANDTDPDGGPIAIDSVTQPTNGTVAITGAGSGLTYQPTPNYCNAPPGTSPDTFTYTLTPGGSTATVSVTVTCVNDAATITTTGAPLAYTEGAAATAVDPGLTVSDSDDASLEGGQVRISAGFEAGDELLFTNQNGITGIYDAGTGVLTLAGTSLLANYQTALRSVQYRHTGDNPATVKTVEFRADDGDGLGPASVRTIDVTRVNDAPTITTTAGSLAYTENAGPVAIDGALTVGDPDSAQLSGATVQISASFQAAQDELGFTDQNGITGAYNDTSGVLTLTGTATLAQYQTALRSVTYENVSDGPTPLTRTISFQVTDSDGAASNTATRGIAITSVNDPPTAANDTGTTDEDTTLNIAAPGVLANDTDVDPGDTKTVDRLNGSPTLTGTSAKGASVTINANGSYTYNPGSVFQGLSTGQQDTDSFTYRMSDGGGASSTATVNLTITGISDAPIAGADSFDAIGNTALSVGTARPTGEAGKVLTGSVLTNDTDVDTPQGNLVAEAGTFATTLGGSITIESDGNFTYHPDDGDVGVTDTFTYRVCDATPCTSTTVTNSTGTLSLPLAGQVWYVQNNEPAGGDGTSDTPFDTLAEAETASGTGDTVYVFDGNNTATGLGTGYAMEANERLIGELNGVSLSGFTLHPGTAGAHPTLAATNEDVVVLASGATLDGFNLDPAGTGGGVSGGTGNTTINDVNVADGGTAGTQPGVELDGTGTATISDLTVSTNGATGVRLNNGAATFAPAGTITITTANARGLDATGTNLGTSTFDSITVTGSGNGGVSMSGTTGTTTFGGLSLTTTSGTAAAFGLASAGTVTVSAAGTANVSATGGPAIDVTGTAGATLAFDAVSSTNSATDGINLAGLGTGTFSAASGTITGATGIAFDLDGGSGDVTFPGAITNGQGSTAEITGRTGGTVTLSGAITESGDADATQENGGIAVTGNSGGSTVVSNATKTFNTGEDHALVMGTSNGHTLTLSGGGFDVDTTSGAGINATDSGTLTVSGTGNSVSTGTGTALNVTDTNFGMATFQSISANGAPNGINLNNTGASAGLTVTGGGNTTQGGDFSGGTIQSTTGHGISLTNTTAPSFRNMRLLNTGNSGVNGTQVNGFSFTDGTITGAGDASDENSITFDDSLTATPNLTGAVTITNNVVSQTEAEGVDIENWGGTISDANISGNALSDTGDVATPGSAVTLIGSGTTTSAASITRASVNNNTITDFRAGVGVQVRAGNPNTGAPTGSAGTAGSATNVITITGNSMNGGNAGIGNQPDRFFTGGVSGNGGQGNFNVSNNGTAANRIRNIDCIAIEMQMDGPVTMTSTVQNNFINANSAVGCAGIAVGTDDPLDLGAGTHSTLISANNVMGTDGPGIFPIVRDSGSTMTARVINNTVAAPITTNAARAGIRVDSGSAQGDTTMCLEISGNTTAGSTNSGTATTSPGINLRKQGTDPAVNTFGIEGLSPSPTGTPTVENFVNSLNTSTAGTFGVGGTALLSAQTGFTSCVAP